MHNLHTGGLGKSTGMLYSVHLLRFFAASIVVMSHAALVLGIPKPVTIGDVGVDIFFIISGLVIGLSTRDNDSAVEFTIKRLIRVVPPYWVATVGMVLLLLYVGKPPSYDDLWRSFLFIPKFGTGWFPIVFPGWTLSYEMLFYLAFGLALIFVPRRISAVCMVSFAMLAVVSIKTSDGLGVNTDLFLEFVFGLAVAEWTKRVSGRSPSLGVLCLVAGLTALYLNRYGPGGSLRWGVPSLFLVAGVLQFEDTKVLRSRACRLLGDASYSIYLFHVLLMLFVQQCTNRLGIDLHQAPLASACVLVFIAITGGIVVDILVIEPLTKFLRGLCLGRGRAEQGIEHAAIPVSR